MIFHGFCNYLVLVFCFVGEPGIWLSLNISSQVKFVMLSYQVRFMMLLDINSLIKMILELFEVYSSQVYWEL